MPIRQVASGVLDHEQPKVDIVAVHGLNPWNNADHAFDTWRKPKRQDGTLWLRDSLPNTLPKARIFLYKYDSSPAFGSTKERFVYQANDLLENVRIERRRDPKRPLILIGYSLGGILIKQALVNAHNNPNYAHIRQATCGLVFFGTPHAGGNETLLTLGKTCARIVTALSANPSNDIMQALQRGSLFSDILQENWRHQLTSYKIISFYEGIGSIVPRFSAVINLPGDLENQVRLDADHSNLCRFDASIEKDRDNLRLVEANIEELYELATAQTESILFPSVPAENPGSAVEYEREVLSDLYFEQMHSRYDEIRGAHKRTFEWVQGFASWLRQGHGIFWIRGKAGSGKSTLMKFIYDDSRTHDNLLANYGVESLLVAGFFFHNRGSLLQKSLRGVLQAVLYQILARFRELIPVAFPIYAVKDKYRSKTHARQPRWTHQELERALLNLVGRSEVVSNVCLFIDALDEFIGSHLEFAELIKTVAASNTHANLKIKFCISSRPLNVFMDCFENLPGFPIHDWTKGDISTYVTTTLQGHPRLRALSRDNDVLALETDELRYEVVQRAFGVFLWVRLVVDNLLQGLTDGDTILELQEQLAALPGDLEGLYRRILQNINRKYLPDAFRYFDIVQCAGAPLTVLQLALATEPPDVAISCRIGDMDQPKILRLCGDMERRLRSRCGGLLELQIKNKSQDSLKSINSSRVDPRTTVQFLHQTLRDFLRVPKNGKQGFDIEDSGPTQDPFVSLMRGTLHALKLLPRRDRDYHKAFPEVWNNMMQSVLMYARNAEASTREPQTDILDELDRAETEIGSSIARNSFDPNCHWSTPLLFHRDPGVHCPVPFLPMAVVAGLVLYVSEKIRTQKVEINSDSGGYLLHWALNPTTLGFSFAAKFDMVKLLLESGASPMHVNRSPEHSYPHPIDLHDDTTAWQHFLQGPCLHRRPLICENLRIMQLLLDYGADPNVKAYRYIPNVGRVRRSPLRILIELSFDSNDPELAALLRTLMERGADIKDEDVMGESVLAFAQRRSSALAAFLLDHQEKQCSARTKSRL